MAKPKNLKKKLSNAGERSKLPAKYLTSKQRQQREMNARLDMPAATIPGTNLASPLTERDLAHQAQAATTVRYAPQEQAIAQQLAQAVQQKTDTGSWYDDYKNRLQGYQQQVGAYQQGAQDAMQHLQAGVTGLGQQDQSFVQGQQAQMPAGTAPVGASVGQDANAALAVRQGIAGNFGAGQAMIGAANNTYASNLANVVGPQQQLTALAGKQGQINKVQQAKTDLKGTEGAYNQQYRSDTKANETKNLLAAGALGVNMTNSKVAAVKAATSAQNQAASLKQRITAENNRHTVAEQNASTSAARLAETERHNQAMERLQAKKAAKAGTKGGPRLTTQQINTGVSQLQNLKAYLARAKSGQAFVEGHPKQTPLGRAGAVQKVRNSTKKLASDALLGAAADAVYDGHISPATARRLKDAGFDPARVARELGVRVGGGGKKVAVKIPNLSNVVPGKTR